MAEISVQITDNSDIFKQATAEAIERALEAIGLQAEGYAKMLCPVDTGNLRNSITHQVAPEDSAVHMGTNVEYVEYGSFKTKAQPYIESAIMENIDKLENMMK